VHRRAAQTSDRGQVVDLRAAGLLLDEVRVARLFHPLGDAAHRPVQRPFLPAVRVRRAVENFLDPMWVDGQLKGVRAFRAGRAFIDRAVVVALDVNDLAALDVHLLAAPDGAVRADARDLGGAADARPLVYRIRAEGLTAGRSPARPVPRAG